MMLLPLQSLLEGADGLTLSVDNAKSHARPLNACDAKFQRQLGVTEPRRCASPPTKPSPLPVRKKADRWESSCTVKSIPALSDCARESSGSRWDTTPTKPTSLTASPIKLMDSLLPRRPRRTLSFDFSLADEPKASTVDIISKVLDELNLYDEDDDCENDDSLSEPNMADKPMMW